MIGQVVVVTAFGEEFEIVPDQLLPPAQKKGDLSGLHAVLLKVRDTGKCAQVVGHCLGRMVHDVTDLAGCFSFQGEPYDLHTMAEHRTDIVLDAP